MACGGSSSSGSCSACTSTATTGNHQTPSYACTGNCTAVCGSCSTGCMSCTGTCSNTCKGSCDSSCSGSCSGGCTGSCGTTCSKACSSYTSCTCGSACTSTCRGSCTGGCSGSCTGCSSGCYQSCTTTCANSCENACSTGCTTYTSCGCGTNCSSTCSGTCSTTCSGTCKDTCSTTCTGGCKETCSGECTGGCKNTCTGTCTDACAKTCAENCTGTCSMTCGDDCSGGCKQTCADDCTNTCTDNCKDNCSSTATTASCGVMCSGECMGCAGTCTASCADDCTNTCKDTCTDTCTDVCTSCTGTCKESCAGTNSLLVRPEELQWIMPYVRNEIYRRSGFNEAGEFLHKPEYRHYSGPILSEPNDALFVLDSDTEVIRVGHGIPIIDMLLKICDFEDARFVREFDLIPGVYNMDKLMRFIEFLRNTPFDAPVSHCRGACTGLCDNNCTTTCIGSCLEECSSCGKMCSGMCSGACLGCSETCGKSCGSSCGDSCSGSVTGCAGCSSGCTGCTGCVNSCEGTCSTTCSSSCSGCTAGCYGNSGYNDTCGACSSACTATCGGEAVSKSNTPNHYSIKLYHNGGLYGKLSTLYHGDSSVSVSGSVGDIIIPPFNTIRHIFPLTGHVPNDERWISALNNTSIPCSDGKNHTITLSAGAPTESSYYSSVLKEMVLYSKTEVGLSFGIVKNTYTATIDNDVDIVIDTDSLINISAKDSDGNVITGARTDTQAIYINGIEYAMPYTGISKKGDRIHLVGDNITYTVQRHKDEVASSSITIPFGQYNPSTSITNGFGIVPFCMCREMKIWFENDGTIHHKLGTLETCELKNNSHVKITSTLRVSYNTADRSNSVPITEPEYVGLCTVNPVPETVTITVTANEFKELCEDGSYIGILYTAGFELYEGYKYGLPLSQTYRTDGRYDSDLNVVLVDASTCKEIDKVPLYRQSTSLEQYSFVIPTISGYRYAKNCSDVDDDAFNGRQSTFQFNQQYTVYGRNSFVLFLYK